MHFVALRYIASFVAGVGRPVRVPVGRLDLVPANKWGEHKKWSQKVDAMVQILNKKGLVKDLFL